MAFLCKKLLPDAPKSLCLNTYREKREGEVGKKVSGTHVENPVSAR